MAPKITFGLATPKGPANPPGGPRLKPISGGAPRSRNKKGYTGTIAGIGHRGRSRIPSVAPAHPHGPAAHPFTATQLPNRKRFTSPTPVPKTTGRLSTLFRRLRGR